MTANGDAETHKGLTMAGPNSPWGSNNGGSGDDTGSDEQSGQGSDDVSSGTGDDKEPENPGEKTGPRNPWLPSGSTPPRRSASIEDIFRSRDPRRGGGGPRGPGGGFPQMPRRPDGSSWMPLIGAGVVAVAVLLSCVHQLDPGEQGVVTRLGRYSNIIDSGLNYTLPWPIDRVAIQDVRSFNVDTIPSEGSEEKLMLTSDKNLVDLTYLVRWNIKDLKNYTFRLADPKETVREVAETAMRASIAQIPLNEAISGDGRAKVEQDVRERMQTLLDYYKSGIAIQGVEIKKSDPPAKTKAAFEQVTVAQQDAEKDRSEARAWAQQKIAEAQGTASQFDKVYEEYKLAPEVTKRRMYYETMERVLHNNDTVVAEAKGVTPYIPLPEVKKAAPAPTATASASSAQGGQ